MKHVLFFFLLILGATQTYSQESEFEMYYPENRLFKKLKVASVLDTIASPAFHHHKEEYDTLGRRISWRYVEDSVVTRFRYMKSGDTLIKYHYYTKGAIEHSIYEYERFVYNKMGKITTYQSCGKEYGYVNNIARYRMEKFFYDSNNRLITKLTYINNKHKHPFSSTLQISDSLLKLVDVHSYAYSPNRNIVIKKQMVGKPAYRSIDSLYYNKANQLVKIVSRQVQGFLGELAVGNLCWTKTFSYETDRQTERSWITYADWEIDKVKRLPEEVNEYLFYPNGLKQAWSHTDGNYPLSRLDYLVYEFHK